VNFGIQGKMLVLAAAVAVFVLIAVSSSHSYTSDDVAQQNAVATISPRSPVLLDLPQNTYIIKFPLYFLVGALPLEPQTKLLLTPLFLGLACIGLFFWSMQAFGRANSSAWSAKAMPLLWLASLGGTLTAALINPNSRNLEIGLAFAMLAIIAKWYQADWPLNTSRRTGLAAPSVAIAGLLFYDDPYFLYVTAVPLILFFGIKWLLFGRYSKDVLILAAMLAAIVLARLWHGLFWLLGIHAGQGSAVFASLPQVAGNLLLFATGVLNLFNANIFGQPILSLSTLGHELNLVVLLATLLSPALLAWPKIRRNVWNVFLVLQPPFVAVSFITSGMPVDQASERYLVLRCLNYCHPSVRTKTGADSGLNRRCRM
jgi:hypothetical protein